MPGIRPWCQTKKNFHRRDAENAQETITVASHDAEIRWFKRTELLLDI